MKIDIHNHILPEYIPDFEQKCGYPGWVSLEKDGETGVMLKSGKHFRTVPKTCWSSAARLSDMDNTGVSMQVLSTVPVMFSYWAKPSDALDISRLVNDGLAENVRGNPERFVALGNLPLQAPELATVEMKRCRYQLGFPGFQIGTHVNQWNLDAKELDPIFATAQEHDCCLFVHPWDMETTGRWSTYWLPWLVGMPAETASAICCVLMGGVLEKYPRLRICFAHGGGSFPATLGRIEHGYRVRPDLCAMNCSHSPISFSQKIYTDSLVHESRALKLLLDVIGEDKIVMGSDYPFPLGESTPGHLIESSDWLTEHQKDKMLNKNACKFLGINTM